MSQTSQAKSEGFIKEMHGNIFTCELTWNVEEKGDFLKLHLREKQIIFQQKAGNQVAYRIQIMYLCFIQLHMHFSWLLLTLY